VYLPCICGELGGTFEERSIRFGTMIEAVNSVLQTTQFVRASSEQVSTLDAFAANPDRVQKAPQAPFISPYIYLDVNYDKAVIQLRNGETGDVENQFPSSTQLEAQARFAARREVQSQTPQPTTPKQSSCESVPVVTHSTTGDEGSAQQTAALTAQHQAAFAAAAQSGNSNAGHVTLFA